MFATLTCIQLMESRSSVAAGQEVREQKRGEESNKGAAE